MNLAQINAAYARSLAFCGESIVLQRAGASDLTVKGIVRGFTERELVGELRQTDKRVSLGNAEIAAASWPAPIVKGDKVVIASKTYTVFSAEQVRVGSDVVRHNLVVRG